MMIENELSVLAANKHIPFPIEKHLVRLMEVGSGGHGTKLDPDNPHFIDDTDLMGIVIPPIQCVVGLKRWEHQVWADGSYDVVLYEWGKFIRLLLKSNPNVLGTLWIDSPILSKSPFDRLVENRAAFASKQAYGSFAGYAFAQTKKMVHLAYQGYQGEKRRKLVDRYGYDCKNAAHAIRIFRMGIEFLRTGEMRVVRPDAEELKAIKSGGWTMRQVEECVIELDKEARIALDQSPLPDQPNHELAEKLLLDGYAWAWDQRKKHAWDCARVRPFGKDDVCLSPFAQCDCGATGGG